MNRPNPAHKPVIVWLIIVELMIVAMVMIGGITRLTESGLSIVEFPNNLVAYHPKSEAEWVDRFEKYQQHPEYRILNREMTLPQFKKIFFWEWLHRIWGHAIGLAFALPFLWFWVMGRLVRKKLESGLMTRLFIALIIGGLQGVIGVWMVKSGLQDVPYVSHFRLAVHLCTALLAFGYIAWIIASLVPETFPRPRRNDYPGLHAWTWVVFVLLCLQIVYGAFVAGLDAGRLYTTFPLMLKWWFPPDAIQSTWQPAIRNFFMNPVAVQFVHRWLGVLLLTAVVWVWIASVRREVTDRVRAGYNWMLAMCCLQVVLGIATLVNGNTGGRIQMAAAHQMTACFLLAAFVVTLQGFQRPRDT
jgi:cytochrome c oxidase assembly protein subunit 15